MQAICPAGQLVHTFDETTYPLLHAVHVVAPALLTDVDEQAKHTFNGDVLYVPATH